MLVVLVPVPGGVAALPLGVTVKFIVGELVLEGRGGATDWMNTRRAPEKTCGWRNGSFGTICIQSKRGPLSREQVRT